MALNGGHWSNVFGKSGNGQGRMSRTVLGLLLMTVLFLSACGSREEQADKGFNLVGVWTLIRVDYPDGLVMNYAKGTYTRCKIYDTDHTYYSVEIKSVNKDVLVIPHECAQYAWRDTTYVENGRPTPFRILNDSTMTTVWKGTLETWRKVRDMSETRKEEIRNTVRENLKYNGDGKIKTQYILSTTEKKLRQTNHMFLLAIVILALGLTLLGYYIRNIIKEKRDLEQKLADIAEERQLRPTLVENALKEVEQHFFESDYYQELHRRILSGHNLPADDWNELDQRLKTVYPGFSSKLRSLHRLSETEYRVCLLIKLRISPNEMAVLLNRSQSAISTIRSRLFQKVFGRKGGAKDWDSFILSL